ISEAAALPPDDVATPPPAPPYLVELASTRIWSAAGAALAAAVAFAWSTQSRRSVPLHQNCPSSAVSRIVGGVGSLSTPDSFETTSTSQTLKYDAYSRNGSVLAIRSHLASACARNSPCSAAV